MKQAKILLAVLLICLLTVTLVACGEQGTPGKDGTSIHTGNGAPSATLGNDGDSYIDLDTFDFYVKANEKWTLSGNIKGDSNGNVSPDHNGTIGLEFYPLNDTECAVGVGTAIYLEEIVIPSTYKGLKVTTISGFRDSFNYSTGFYGCENLKTITIPDSVTTIGDSAFSECSSLTSIVIPDSVTTIGECAFLYCSSLTSIVIPDSVTTIGERAFDSCYSLVEVYNKSSLNITKGSTDNGYVGYYAFNVYTEEGGSKLTTNEDGSIIYTDGADKILVGYVGKQTDLIIPDGIKEIYKYAFSFCDSLTSIVIPDSVTTIGEYAFYDCTSLRSVTFGENSQLPTIGDRAFYGCTSLTSIVIPDSVTTIGSYTFNDCISLTSVIFGENSQLTTISSSAFYGCKKLTSIVIPDSVTTIDWRAFFNCTSLTSIVIPDSVTTISSSAFEYCTGLMNVFYTGTEEQWKAISIGYANEPLTNATIHYNYVVEE